MATSFRIFTASNLLNPDATVDQLIDGDSKWWNNNLLSSLFAAVEVSLIQKISPSCTSQEDGSYLEGTKKEVFSVRSPYYMQNERATRHLADCSSNGVRSTVWKRLWSLSVPNCEKNFLWRACSDILPTRENLFKKKIIMDPTCPLCGREVGSGFPILWQCPSAMSVWSKGCPKIQKSSFVGPDFMQVVEGVFSKCSNEEVEQFVGIIRRIWMRRNETLHAWGGFCSPEHPGAANYASHR